MVSAMVQSAAADEVFHALSNPTRRKVLERLSVGPATVSELALKLLNEKGEFISGKDGEELLRIAEKEEFDFVPVTKLGKYKKVNEYIEKHIDLILQLPIARSARSPIELVRDKASAKFRRL